MHGAPATGRADRLPAVRGPGGGPGRERARPRPRRLRLPLVPRARGRDRREAWTPSSTSSTTAAPGTAVPYDPIANRFAPICVPVATQIVHAVGWALGAKLDGRGACALAYFGDGSASEGDFHEAANMAAVFGAPAILFCQNNGWAISVPLAEQTAAPIARRAAGYGFPGVRVDGNDVLAVYAVTEAAVERARAGDGPTLHRGRHLPDRARTRPPTTTHAYRDEDEVAGWRERDPIERLAPVPARDRHRRRGVRRRRASSQADAWVVRGAGRAHGARTRRRRPRRSTTCSRIRPPRCVPPARGAARRWLR